MRSSLLFYAITLSFFAEAIPARRCFPSSPKLRDSITPKSAPQQQPLFRAMDLSDLAVLPGSSQGSDPSGSVILSDVLGKDRSINVFAGLTRDIASISNRLDTQSKNTTVLAPLNSAITSLPRKPWEDPKDYKDMGANAYSGSEGQDRARENLQRFVEAHIVPVSPWKEGEKVETLGGGKVWFSIEDGTKRIQPGNIEVSSVVEKVANGEVWILKGTLNYA